MEFEYGRIEQVAPGVRRVIANNPSAFTFHGTGTYILGEGEVAVIDPGPLDPNHIEAIFNGIEEKSDPCANYSLTWTTLLAISL